nr:type II secretion system protein [uncultured Oscillibacter sp.]
MLKRLKNIGNRGFSLVETLAVVAILVILLSLSFVAAAYYRDYLKITELDNAAREIYMAAENRAVLLNGGGQLDGALADGGAKTLADEEEGPRYITHKGGESADSSALGGLLTYGAIDPALLKGDFYIVYDPASGAVTDVFYTEKNGIQPIGAAFALAAEGRDARMRPEEGPMLGYYGGEQEARADYTPLPAPEVMVVVENGDMLRVHVTFSVPDSALSIVGNNWRFTAKQTVELKYGNEEPITLMDTPASFPPKRIARDPQTTASPGNTSITYTWILDALDRVNDNGSTVEGRHFRQLFKNGGDGMTFGGDFTVTAKMELSAPGRRSTSASGSDSGNSLFAEHSGGEIAQVENLRHLQNLDTETSNAGGKIKAVQLADVDCCGKQGREPYGKYEFRPIVNEDLRSFDGGQNEITDLRVTEASVGTRDGAGLFATTYGAEAKGSTPASPVKFTGVRLVGAEVSSSKPAGALVGCAQPLNEFRDILVSDSQVKCTGGEAKTAAAGGVVGGGNTEARQDTDGIKYKSAKAQTFEQIRVVNTSVSCGAGAAGGVAGRISGSSPCTDCRVYWEPEAGQQNLRSLLGSDTTQYRYQITGNYAGGLVGHFDKTNSATSGADTFTITKSFASSMLKGTRYTGGLLGGSMSVIIKAENSYADCYLAGGRAAGLIGNTTNTTIITDCYAAGFIDVKETDVSAGLCLGSVKVEAHRAYSVMSYPGISADSTVYPLVENIDDTAGRFEDSYYLAATVLSGGPDDSRGKSYDEMSGKDFAGTMGGAFEFKKVVSDSNPYNLQEKQTLNPPYAFPGLKGLPHYGDWKAYFKEPSLVYYEQDSTGKIGFSGGNARELIGELDEDKNIVVRTDGYAVALLKKDLPDSGSFTVTYHYFNADGTPAKPEEVTYGADGTKLLEAVWDRIEGGMTTHDEYWLAPLPDKLIIGTSDTTEDGKQVFQAVTSKEFYQYLRFETGFKLSASEDAGNASGEYFYNPHFAETVKPYVPEAEGKPFIDWGGKWTGEGEPPLTPENAAQGVYDYITQTLTPGTRPVSVSVRTPRHLFHLSQYADYYNNARLAFQQGLTLDGYYLDSLDEVEKKYTGYQDIGLLKHDGRGFQEQSPIGTQAQPFLGSYDGNCLPIRRVAFQIPEGEKNRVCAGLFGCSNGTLRNIVYSLNPNPGAPENPDGEAQKNEPRSVVFPSSERNTYLGALVGLNGLTGTVSNCAVDSVSLTSRVYTSKIYIGGLCGGNEGTILNSAAECAYLHVDASNYGSAYVGGLVGYNSKQVEASYAVGRLAAEAAQENAPVLLAGFVGLNSGSVSDSYAAMDLKTDGVSAAARGFCGQSSGGRQAGTYYLNDGNFSYRGGEFLAKYEECEGGAARPVSYVDLTAEASPVSGMSFKAERTGENAERVFPYPTGVKKGEEYWHYGQWPKPLKLGAMGVYYWEELKVPGKAPSYHVSLLAVDPGENKDSPKTVTKLSTLSTAHDEGGEVTRFGYGIYDKRSSNPAVLTTATLEKTPYPLMYDRQGGPAAFTQEVYTELESDKEQGQNEADKRVDDELARLMTYELGSGYRFHSFHTYGQDEDGGAGGLYPNAGPATPNGTLTLQQGGSQQVTITFALNPLFADALAVENTNGLWELKNGALEYYALNDSVLGASVLGGDTPGSEGNAYEVRSIDQLQFIDWNSVNRNTTTVLVRSRGTSASQEIQTIETFPYLSRYEKGDKEPVMTGQYSWTQTYDILGEKEADGTTYKKYTPIAEYYDVTTGDQAILSGWFGGSYDGGSYKIENVNVEGQVSSCTGLFGVVYNAHLKNIVLYSSDGEGTISTRAGGNPKTKSLWYAMGALAGVAGTSEKDEKPVIENCSVAGYTIDAQVYTYAEQGKRGYGGNNIGGLVGACDLSLKGCSAVTAIQVHDAVENDNMRVGGLTGVCQGVVENCYAGGSISIRDVDVLDANSTSNPKGIYVGGLVGGSYMRPLNIEGSGDTIGVVGNGTNETNNTLRGCYSYVTLPALTGEGVQPHLKSMYAVGGTGEIAPLGQSSLANHGICYMNNCYFLTSEVMANYGGSTETYLDAIADTKAKTDVGTKSGGSTGGGTGGGSTGGGITDVPTYEVGKDYNPAELSLGMTPKPKDGVFYFYSDYLYGSFGDGVPVFTMNLDTNMATFRGYVTEYKDDSTWELSQTPPGTEKPVDPVDPDKPPVDPDKPSYTYDDAVTGLTYEQLSGPPTDMDKTEPGYQAYQIKDGKTIYELLPSDFRRVTAATEDGISVPGKYSYPTQTRPELRDRNYPFPTIVTKEDGKYQVHYGDWPLKGFRRQTPFDEDGSFSLLGGSPIEIDLFVNGTKPHEEYLVLTDGVPAEGGKWTDTIWDSMVEAGGDSQVGLIAGWEISEKLSSEDIPNIREDERDKDYYRLTLTPTGDGTDILCLKYTTADGNTYTLAVTVHITAVAELRPSRLYMFPNDVLEVSVRATTKDGEALDDVLENGRLILEGDPNCQNTGYLRAETLRAEATAEGGPAIRFTTTVPEDAPGLESGLTLGANAGFAYKVPTDQENPENPGRTYRGDIRVEVIQPWKNQEEDWTVFGEDEAGRVVCTVSFPSSHEIYEEKDLLGTLLFAESGSPSVEPMPSGQPTAAWKTEAGKIALTLTYPEGVTLENLPDTTVYLPLTMTSQELVEGEQAHTLTLHVKKPPAEAENPPEPFRVEALPPAEDGQDSPARRRWKREYRRRYALRRGI